MTLEELAALDGCWPAQGCIVKPAHEVEVGAGRMHPTAFLRSLGPQPWRIA
ncbi:MAG: glycine--tRNA ligase subunit alpha [Armatimonadetes bacterium]|nr:glycine--tRNA ligase subunit alpha [Armatimonadota bacterium]